MADIGSRPLEAPVRERKMAEVRAEVRGIVKAATEAVTDEQWAEVGRRFGAMQRRSREIAGQGKGG